MPAFISAPPQGPHDGPLSSAELVRWYLELVIRMLLDYSNQAVKFLTLANAGGGVALLGFMGNSEVVRTWDGTWGALWLYAAGFVCAGTVACLNFVAVMYMATRFTTRASQAATGNLSFSQIIDAPRWLTWSVVVPIAVAALSLACFVAATRSAIGGFRVIFAGS